MVLRQRAAAAVLVTVSALFGAGTVFAQVRPNGSWQQIRSQNFTVIYEAGLDSIARRAVQRAEHERARLATSLIGAPKGHIDIVIADNMDQSNGNARPFPNSRITIWVRPPVEELSLQHYDDWIDLVITHELVHIFHQEPAGKVGRGLRALFGRVPFPWPFFPILATPDWSMEGLATVVESRNTGAGRLKGSYHEMVARTAILENAFPTIDRISGESPLWPGGTRQYVYGSLFMDYIERRFGADAHTTIIKRSAGSLLPPPWRMDGIAKGAVGRSFSDLYNDWRAELTATYTALADTLTARGLTQSERITTTGRWALHPRVSADGERLAYSDENARDVTATRVVNLKSGEDTRIRRNGLGRTAWLPDSRSLLTEQMEFADRYSIHSDLYIERGGGTERITNGARAESPDLSADGQRIIYVQNVNGSNRLVVREMLTGTERVIAERSPDVHWILPRWSPDGSRIAVQRWTRDGGHDIAVLMADGGEVATVRMGGSDAAPAWSPDGRYVIFSSDRTGISNLYAFEVNGIVRQITNVLGGAFYPDVSPDGKSIYYSGYHADGFYIERIPFDTTAWTAMQPFARPDARRIAPDARDEAAATPAVAAPEAYSAARSLAPKYWVPILTGDEVAGEFIGVATAGEDAIGRHFYMGMLGYDFGRGRTTGDLAYSYAGFGNPVITLEAARLWDNLGRVAIRNSQNVVTDTADSYDREDRIALSASFVNRKWRASHALTVGMEGVAINRKIESAVQFTDPRDRMFGVLAGVSFANTRVPALAISREDGVRASATVRQRFEIDPAVTRDRSYREVSSSAAAYKNVGGSGFAHNVLAARVSALHRNSVGTNPTGIGGVDDFLPVRGHKDNARIGSRVWTASLEYRVPLRIIARGYRLRPLFIDRVSAAFFVDAGDASCSEEQRAVYVSCAGNPLRPKEMLTSAGFELNANIALLSFVPTWTRTGIGFPIGGESRTAQVYLTIAPAF